MNNCFIILAAGESKRFKSKTPKPYYLYRGKPLFQHSIDKAKESNKFKKIVLVINKKHKKFLKNTRLKDIKIISRATLRINKNWRFDSFNSIKLLSIKVKSVKKPTDKVIIKIKPINIFFLIKSNIM